MIVQCCICQRVRDGEAWRPADPAELKGNNISHGYCPDCEDKYRADNGLKPRKEKHIET